MSLMKTRRGKWLLLIAVMMLSLVVLSGCAPTTTVTHTTQDLKEGGFWQSNVVYYFAIALDKFADWFNGEYGLAVLVMVIIVRTLILPLTIKQVKSSRAMQAIQPELQKIQKKYKDTPEKVQQETMRLFQENKVNPMAGCLPLIVQMPIFIALYNSIYYNPGLSVRTIITITSTANPYSPLETLHTTIQVYGSIPSYGFNLGNRIRCLSCRCLQL